MNSTDGENTMEKEEDNYTKDRTVHYRGNPANKKKTGTWKACPYILEDIGQLPASQSSISSYKTMWVGIGGLAFPRDHGTCCCEFLFRYSVVSEPEARRQSSDSDMSALETGGIKSCVSSYGADQFDDADEAEKKHKSSFFNWFYFSIIIGALIASSVLVWVQDNVGWNWGFGIPTVTMALAVVTVASVRKCHIKVPEDKSLLYETADAESAIKGSRKLDHTKDLSFFDKAAVEVESSDKKSSKDPWSLCTVTQVEELKTILRLLPIWATGIIFAAVYNQMGNFFVLQGERMDSRLGHTDFHIPPASLGIFDTLSVIFWVPVYDRIIVPFARKFTGHKNGLTQLQRMGIGLVISIFTLLSAALGTGGIKSCVSSYGADQFDDADEAEKKHKSSFFNWFYFSINIGALIASSVLVWVQDNVGWNWGFGIPTVTMALAVVTVASVRKCHIKVPEDKSLLYETADAESAIKGSRKLDHTKDLSFFDKAAVEVESSDKKSSKDPWSLCTVTQVEELKTILRLLPIWATGIIFAAVYNQMGNFFVLQGERMDSRLGHTDFHIPPASLGIFDTLSVIFWVPVYDRIIVPFARKFTGHKNGLTQLQRLGIGLVISIFTMLSAGILELVRLRIVKKHNYYDYEQMPMSIFWQVP
ncbi:hypothetical protein RHMOL_Rhmol13G0089500 [Rhododendron molle]|uniref:Uncharacterized protein n=1 Tax=Rhododendron molle TaxID=49168 RepID=A0ACC0L548_RHOML|nr:hypothetical protein RHMOL_Rhmol13G0089500 [Rhododendron molle]